MFGMIALAILAIWLIGVITLFVTGTVIHVFLVIPLMLLLLLPLILLIYDIATRRGTSPLTFVDQGRAQNERPGRKIISNIDSSKRVLD